MEIDPPYIDVAIPQVRNTTRRTSASHVPNLLGRSLALLIFI
jgi:hypothetical protein